LESNWRYNAWLSTVWPLGPTLLAHIHGSAGRWISNWPLGGIDHLVWGWTGDGNHLATILDGEHVIGGGPHFPYGFIVDPDSHV